LLNQLGKILVSCSSDYFFQLLQLSFRLVWKSLAGFID
jgi:hypothetical protein